MKNLLSRYIILFAVLLHCVSLSFGQEVEKLPLHFNGDTVRVAQCPVMPEKYYQCWDFTISKFYVVIDSLSYDDTHIAILSPITMTPEVVPTENAIMADRLLLIQHQGKKTVYDQIIKNEEWTDGASCCEHLHRTEEGFMLDFEAGQGWKIYYRIDITIRKGIPQITKIYFEEHNGSGTYQRQTECSYTEQNEFPLSEYDRSIPDKVRNGEHI